MQALWYLQYYQGGKTQLGKKLLFFRLRKKKLLILIISLSRIHTVVPVMVLDPISVCLNILISETMTSFILSIRSSSGLKKLIRIFLVQEYEIGPRTNRDRHYCVNPPLSHIL